MKSVLFIDKVFLKKKPDRPVRGVELFNMILMRELVELGFDVTLIAEQSWAAEIRSRLGVSAPTLLRVQNAGIDFLSGLLGALKAQRKGYEILVVANAGKSLMPMTRLLCRRCNFKQVVAIPHREATPAFVNLFSALPGHIVAVNKVIAEPFIKAGHSSVHVDYGVLNASLYHPEALEQEDEGFINFCVMGALDNAWKGADTAIQAFRAMPVEMQDRCRLHLASYEALPVFEEANIVPHTWMPPEEIPEFLRGMDVMIVPSRDEQVMRETFSQVCVQGMLTALPVLVSDLPILSEKVDEGGGKVFHDAEHLSRLMVELMEGRAAREEMGLRAREVALERYVWDTSRFAERYLKTEI